jgi:hypothetical protein
MFRENPPERWRKSARSGLTANCVEVALGDDDAVRMRDSKNPEAGALCFARQTFLAFLTDVKSGRYDRPGRVGPD